MSDEQGKTRRRLCAGLLGVAAAGLVAGLPAEAATVYRCGPDGRVFSDTPCRDGEKLSLTGQPALLAPGEARDVAQREARLAAQLERERHARSAAAVSGPGGIGRASLAADTDEDQKPRKKPRGKSKSGRDAKEGLDEGVLTPPLRGAPAVVR